MYLLQTSLHQTFGMELLYHLLPDKTNLQLETWYLDEAQEPHQVNVVFNASAR